MNPHPEQIRQQIWQQVQQCFRKKQTREAMQTSPLLFREQLRVDPDFNQPLREIMQPWQAADFAALDTAWLQLAGQPVPAQNPIFQRAYMERPRGHAKTSDMAIQLAWILLCSDKTVHGLAAAADRDQANLILQAVQRIARLNPELCDTLQFQKHNIRNPDTDSRLEIISSNVQSSWGALPDFVICDELCHWEQPDLWYSLLSSAAKRPNCVLAVLTNAGVGHGWQWDVREAARTNCNWYFSSLAGAQAPWISEPMLSEQRALLPRAVYQRLWENIWQATEGTYLTVEEVAACADVTLRQQSRGQSGLHYIAAIDYAEKHDLTVGVVVHRAHDHILVDRMDVVRPQANKPTSVAWVETWMQRIATDFKHVSFVVDEYQLLGTIQKLGAQFDIQRFEFLAGKGNHALAVTLRQLVLQQTLKWYPACGQIPDETSTDNLETEMAALILRQSAAGHCRIDHRSHQHDDRAFALGIACLQLLKHSSQAEPSLWNVLPPEKSGGFSWSP